MPRTSRPWDFKEREITSLAGEWGSRFISFSNASLLWVRALMTTSLLRFRTRVLSNKRPASSFLLFAPQLLFTLVLSLSPGPPRSPTESFPLQFLGPVFPLSLSSAFRRGFRISLSCSLTGKQILFPRRLFLLRFGSGFQEPTNKSKESPPHPKHSIGGCLRPSLGHSQDSKVS